MRETCYCKSGLFVREKKEFFYHIHLTEGTVYCDKCKAYILSKLYPEISGWEMFDVPRTWILHSLQFYLSESLSSCMKPRVRSHLTLYDLNLSPSKSSLIPQHDCKIFY